jgi:hypothetical protein
VRVTPSNSSASFWNGVGKRDDGVRRLRRDDEIERHGGEVISQAAEAWHTFVAAPPAALVFGGIRDVGLPRPEWARPAAARSRSWAELVPRLRGIATRGWSCRWINFCDRKAHSSRARFLWAFGGVYSVIVSVGRLVRMT